MTVENTTLTENAEVQKSSRFDRNPILALYLLWLMFSGATQIYSALSPIVANNLLMISPDYPIWVLQAKGLLGFLNIIFAASLVQWKKWGFFGILATGVLHYIVMVSADFFAGGFYNGLIKAAILFVLLHIGKNKAWSKLTW